MSRSTLYHTSSQLIEEIYDSELFGKALFFSERRYYMSENSNYVYTVEIDDNLIIEASSLFYHEYAKKLDSVVNFLAGKLDIALEDAESLLDCSLSGCDLDLDMGDSWLLQKLSLQCAQILGFKGVELKDESGISYLVSIKDVKELHLHEIEQG